VQAVLRLARTGAADRRPDAIAALGGILRGHSDPVARELCAGYAEGDDRDSALEAVDALAALADPAAAPRLQRLLTRASSASDAGLRRRVVAALAEVHGELAVLLGRLEDDPDPKVRAEAAWALGKAGGGTPGAVEPTLVRALGSSSAAVRANAAGALARLGRSPSALTRLLDDRDPAARANAALALARHVTPDARPALDRLRSDEDRRVRAAATRTAPPAAAASRTEWIALHLVDYDGAPLGDARYQLLCPDALIKSGFADARGTVREEALPPGACQLELPDDLPPTN
jgi:HEAT repeat protein